MTLAIGNKVRVVGDVTPMLVGTTGTVVQPPDHYGRWGVRLVGKGRPNGWCHWFMAGNLEQVVPNEGNTPEGGNG